jgi:hypothetical protein
VAAERLKLARCAAAAVLVPDAQESEDPPFDATRAASYVGRTILVGLTYCDARGREIQHQQLHGTVRSATRAGILIALGGERAGETWNMPPELEAISPAEPGEYRLRATGQVVRDPDLLATWTIHTPPARGAADVIPRLLRNRALLGVLAVVGALAVGVSRLFDLPFVPVLLLLLAGVLVNGLVAVLEDDLPGTRAGTAVRWASALALLAFALAFAQSGLATTDAAGIPFVLGMALACAVLAAAVLARRRSLVWVATACALAGTALMAALH